MLRRFGERRKFRRLQYVTATGFRKQYYGNSTGTYIEQERGRVTAHFRRRSS